LWCVPYPQEFLFRTDIDLETGHMDLADMGGWA
jgi:type VI secretion system protein ImpF